VLPIPSVADLADFTGRPEQTFSAFARSALIQAALLLSIRAELNNDDFDGLDSDDQQMVLFGVMDMADFIYLRKPYQQLIASPLTNETIGSYSYGKAQQQVGRNAAALELGAETTGRIWYDLAYQLLAKRTRAGGVFSGGITVFEEGSRVDQVELLVRIEDNRLVLVGPQDRDQRTVPFDINAPLFPMDPSGF
jgi:hypothetical protein